VQHRGGVVPREAGPSTWNMVERRCLRWGFVPSSDEPPTPDPIWVGDVRIRMLAAAESARLGVAVRAVYGETYPVLWTYDADEVARRITAGLLMSSIAETADGELLCHSGLSLAAPEDVVGHAGQALTLPAARGQHIFTAVKRYLVEWATARGLVGMYSEATAAHPFSQRALIDLGGHETGFLLGFIPESVDNSVSAPSLGRQSAALFFLRVRPGQHRRVYAPNRHREIVQDTIAICDFRAELADAPVQVELPPVSQLVVEVRPGDNVAVLTVSQAGDDLTVRVDAERSRLFADGIDALYVDLPLDRPESAHVSDALEELKLSYSGIFPNHMAAGDVLRLQCLRNATALSHDVAVASAHGSALLEYVVADMEAAGQPVVRTHDHRRAGTAGAAPAASVPLVTAQ
jgi:GNAT superfamily N-acetyltransferase